MEDLRMKKEYITPNFEIVNFMIEAPLLDSSPIESEEFEIGYGGVDELGEKEPE